MLDYLQAHGRETTSTERQTFRFHSEVLYVGKILVSYVVLIPGSAAQVGRGDRKAALHHQHMCISLPPSW